MVIFIHTNSLFPEFNTLKSDFQIGTIGTMELFFGLFVQG